MIHGIGIDIVSISRFESLYRRFNIRLAQKLLSSDELEFFNALPAPKQVHFLAKHFAAKEAASKALGTGFREGVTLKDFIIIRNRQGKPEIFFEGEAKKIAALHRITHQHVSFSDELTHVVAMVVFEKA